MQVALFFALPKFLTAYAWRVHNDEIAETERKKNKGNARKLKRKDSDLPPFMETRGN